jgi:hypothetical protein
MGTVGRESSEAGPFTSHGVSSRNEILYTNTRITYFHPEDGGSRYIQNVNSTAYSHPHGVITRNGNVIK